MASISSSFAQPRLGWDFGQRRVAVDGKAVCAVCMPPVQAVTPNPIHMQNLRGSIEKLLCQLGVARISECVISND